jgi:hypothetical protein
MRPRAEILEAAAAALHHAGHEYIADLRTNLDRLIASGLRQGHAHT